MPVDKWHWVCASSGCELSDCHCKLHSFVSAAATTVTKPLLWSSCQKQLDDSLLLQTPSMFLSSLEKQLEYDIKSGLILGQFDVIDKLSHLYLTNKTISSQLSHVFRDPEQNHAHSSKYETINMSSHKFPTCFCLTTRYKPTNCTFFKQIF